MEDRLLGSALDEEIGVVLTMNKVVEAFQRPVDVE